MPTLTETEDRLRRTLDAVATSVNDLDEPSRHTAATTAWAQPRMAPGRQSILGRRPLLVFAASFLAVLAVGAISILTTGAEPDDVAGPSATTLDDTPSQADDVSWATTAGVAVSDEEFAARSGGPLGSIVSGSARRVATQDIPDMGTLELYTVQLGSSALGLEEKPETQLYCIQGPAFTDVFVGGGRCAEDTSLYEFGISLSSSSVCAANQVNYIAIWGLSSDQTTVEMVFSDGTIQTLQPKDGIVLWAWKGDVGLEQVNVEGATAAETQEFTRTDGYWGIPSQPCSDSAIQEQNQQPGMNQDPVEDERQLAEAASYESLYQTALDGEGPSAPPSFLADLDASIHQHLTDAGRILVSASTSREDGTGFEEAVYTNGKDWISLSWQKWPNSVDPAVLYPDDAEVESIGTLDVITRQDQHPENSTMSIAVFDGEVLAQVNSGNTELDLDTLTQIALEVHTEVRQKVGS